MGREEFDPRDGRTTRSRTTSTPTERLPRDGDAHSEPLRRDWRGNRVNGRSRTVRRLPASRQEFILWLQRGGWLLVSGLVGVVVIALLMLIVLRPPRPLTGTNARATPAVTSVSGANLPLQPTITPRASTPVPDAPVANGAQFRVTGTSDQGLFLRVAPNVDQPPVKTLLEGAVVTIIGADSVGPDRVWKHVRDADGAEGWVAADFLQPVE